MVLLFPECLKRVPSPLRERVWRCAGGREAVGKRHTRDAELSCLSQPWGLRLSTVLNRKGRNYEGMEPGDRHGEPAWFLSLKEVE